MTSETTKKPILELIDVRIEVEGKTVIQDLSLQFEPGKVYAIMGRNGAGKTTLSHAIMGHPRYEITKGQLLFEGEDLTPLEPSERAKKGIFLAFQNPVGVPGITVANLLRASLRAVRKDVDAKQVRPLIREELKRLGIPETFMNRAISDGFSGGERKRLETLQLRLLQPKLAILDETDSGLDIDALKTVAETIDAMRSPDRALVVITHYQRMLNYIRPDIVHVLLNGSIVRTGGPELALELEKNGYQSFGAEFGARQL